MTMTQTQTEALRAAQQTVCPRAWQMRMPSQDLSEDLSLRVQPSLTVLCVRFGGVHVGDAVP